MMVYLLLFVGGVAVGILITLVAAGEDGNR